jgi:hypothetical protein
LTGMAGRPHSWLEHLLVARKHDSLRVVWLCTSWLALPQEHASQGNFHFAWQIKKGHQHHIHFDWSWAKFFQTQGKGTKTFSG